MKFIVCSPRRSPIVIASVLLGLGIVFGILRAQNQPPKDLPVQKPSSLYLDTNQPIDKRVEDLLGRMTLEEKISQIHGNSMFTTPAIPRLGIPVRWLTDGPQGVREDVGPFDWRTAGHTDDYATYMPALCSLASTWNLDLATAFGNVLGQESRKRGKDIVLGPIADITRTPLCGRVYEYFGEDPFLNARMSVNYIRGVQTNDVAACIKHFAGNNQDDIRFKCNAVGEERYWYEYEFPAYKACVQEAHAASVMTDGQVPNH